MLDVATAGNMIELTLFDYVERFVVTVPDLPKSFPNIDFDIPDSGKYIEVIHLPNKPINYALDSDTPPTYRGILRLLVHYPPNEGNFPARHLAGVLIGFFKKNTFIWGTGFAIKINDHPYQDSPITENSKMFVPVSISYIVINNPN